MRWGMGARRVLRQGWRQHRRVHTALPGALLSPMLGPVPTGGPTGSRRRGCVAPHRLDGPRTPALSKAAEGSNPVGGNCRAYDSMHASCKSSFFLSLATLSRWR